MGGPVRRRGARGGRRGAAQRQVHRPADAGQLARAAAHARGGPVLLLDFGGGTLSALSGLPHVGGVATRLRRERVRRTVAEVRATAGPAGTACSPNTASSRSRLPGHAASGQSGDGFGDVFLVVDGWLTLRQDYEDLEPDVTALAARGLGYGIHVMAATSKWSEFRPAIRDLFGTKLELRLGDPYESEIGRTLAANVPAALTRPRADPRRPAFPHRTAAAGPGRGARRGSLSGSRAPPGHRPPSPSGMAGAAGATHQAAARRCPLTGCQPAVGRLVPFASTRTRSPPVGPDFAADPHFLVFGDTECGKSNLLRVLAAAS